MFRIYLISFNIINKIFLGTEDEEEVAFREEVFKEDLKKLEVTNKITNQFHYLERATQTKNNDTMETSAQTDPPPMYVQCIHQL